MPSLFGATVAAGEAVKSGGTFVFGLDEKSGFTKVGVYDAQNLERRVMPLLLRYYAAIFVILVLVTYIPALSTCLPALAGY